VNPSSRRAAALLIGVTIASLAFVAGRWSGALQKSLGMEAGYPWDLHRKIGQAGIGCETLAAKPSSGRFHVLPQGNGATLIVASFDRETGKVTAFAIEGSGRMASDTWVVECPR
jgi:hypothetical protein